MNHIINNSGIVGNKSIKYEINNPVASYGEYHPQRFNHRSIIQGLKKDTVKSSYAPIHLFTALNRFIIEFEDKLAEYI